MKTLSLRAQAKAAPKYVLKVDGANFYLANSQPLSGINLTDNIKEAQLYSVGFDDPSMKCYVWTLVLQRVSEDKTNVFVPTLLN